MRSVVKITKFPNITISWTKNDVTQTKLTLVLQQKTSFLQPQIEHFQLQLLGSASTHRLQLAERHATFTVQTKFQNNSTVDYIKSSPSAQRFIFVA